MIIWARRWPWRFQMWHRICDLGDIQDSSNGCDITHKFVFAQIWKLISKWLKLLFLFCNVTRLLLFVCQQCLYQLKCRRCRFHCHRPFSQPLSHLFMASNLHFTKSVLESNEMLVAWGLDCFSPEHRAESIKALERERLVNGHFLDRQASDQNLHRFHCKRQCNLYCMMSFFIWRYF